MDEGEGGGGIEKGLEAMAQLSSQLPFSHTECLLNIL